MCFCMGKSGGKNNRNTEKNLVTGFPLDLEKRVHLENLEISWNFVKFNKYHGKMTFNPGKTLWLLKIHPGLPDLEALIYNL